MTRRFELGSGVKLRHDDALGETSIEFTGRPWVTLPVAVCTAFHAALTECGYGPAVGVCRWTQTGDAEYPCFSVGCCNQSDFVAPGPETGNFCPYCGKRIEVVR